MLASAPSSTLLPYTTLFRSNNRKIANGIANAALIFLPPGPPAQFGGCVNGRYAVLPSAPRSAPPDPPRFHRPPGARSEEHTSELQSRGQLVCRLLHEKREQH